MQDDGSARVKNDQKVSDTNSCDGGTTTSCPSTSKPKKTKSCSESSSSSYSTASSTSTSPYTTTSDENDNLETYRVKGRRSGVRPRTTSPATTTTSVATEENEDSGDDDAEPPVVPSDPKQWTADHIKSWLRWCSKQFNIVPKAMPERFPTNGEELCQMTKADFWVCAGTPTGGDILAKYLATWIYRTSGKEREDLTNNAEPGELLFCH